MNESQKSISNRMKLEIELCVYNLASHFWEKYDGGCWKFASHGQFWYPLTESVDICNSLNYFEGTLSPKAAGISFSMMACSSLSMKYFTKNPDFSDLLSNHYYSLREFVFKNFSEDEQTNIFSFLD